MERGERAPVARGEVLLVGVEEPGLSACLPKGLREQFELKHAQGMEPVIIRDRTGEGWKARKKRGPNQSNLQIVGGTDTERPRARARAKAGAEAEPEPSSSRRPWVGSCMTPTTFSPRAGSSRMC